MLRCAQAKHSGNLVDQEILTGERKVLLIRCAFSDHEVFFSS